MSLLQITNLWPPFTGADLEESEVVIYVPVLHYHALEGPSKKRHSLIGPQATAHAIEGPSRKTKIITGAN